MKIPVIPSGNLDLENDIPYLKRGDIRNALDVTPISDGHGTTNSWEPIRGNALAYRLGTQTVQKKIIQIFLSVGVSTYELEFRRPNGFIIGSGTVTQNADLNTMLASAEGEILGIIGVDGVATANYTDGCVEVYMNDPYGWEWFINNIGLQQATFKTIQEGIDIGASGNFQALNFYDSLGDQFSWSCTRKDFAEDVAITAVTNVSGAIGLTIPNHGLQNGEAFFITGITDNGISMDGEWIALQVLDAFGNRNADKIILHQSTYTGAYVLTSAKATINAYSVGQIGVATPTFTSLIKSKSLNLRKRTHSYIEKGATKNSIYFTDGINPIRVLYYFGDYELNGFLNTLNGYSYENIETESRLIIDNTDITLTYLSTIQTGGTLLSGNYRYSVRFLTESLTESDWTPLSDVINIYSGTNYNEWFGDPDGTATGRVNQFTVTDIPVGIYKYIELGYVLYSNAAQISYKLPKIFITGATMNLTHSGQETVEAVDLGTLNQDYGDIQTAESLDVLDNRLIASNLTSTEIKDFSSFFQSFKHKLKRKTISGVGGAALVPFDSVSRTEYLDEVNVHFNKSFQINETYRLGAHAKLKNGRTLKNVFHIDDIRIDTNTVNTGSTVDRRDNTGGSGGLPDYAIQIDSGYYNPFCIYIQLTNIDWSFLIDGKYARDLIDKIYIDMVEMTDQYKEVLGTGIVRLGCKPDSGDLILENGNGFLAADSFGFQNLGSNITEFSFDSGMTEGTNFDANFGALHAAHITSTIGKKFASFYSPDFYLSGYPTFIQGTDKLLCSDTFVRLGRFDTNIGNQNLNGIKYLGKYSEYEGYNTGDIYSVDIEEAHIIEHGSFKLFTVPSPNITFQKSIRIDGALDSGSNTYNDIWKNPKSIVFYSNNGGLGFLPNGVSNSSSQLYGYYYRNKSLGGANGIKFGDPSLSTYVPTGAVLKSPNTLGVSTADVYGDTFIQVNYLKIRYPEHELTPYNTSAGKFWAFGWGYGTKFHSQNRVNSQMRYASTGGVANLAPNISVDQWTQRDIIDPIAYSNGYTVRNVINQLPGFDSNVVNVNKFPTRVAYSDLKPNNSPVDNYRSFHVLNFRDLDQGAGEIVHHEIMNGELVTFQRRSFQRQYFNSNALISSGGVEIVLGDGAALQRRGLQVSSLGTDNKYSIIKGVSKGGNDVLAWYNQEYGYIIRYGLDGTNPISTVHNVGGFIENDIKFTKKDNDPPHGVWNDERKEWIWTFHGRNTNKNLFNPRKYYNQNDLVYAYTLGSGEREQTPRIYRALQNTFQSFSGQISAVDVLNQAYWQDQTAGKSSEYTLAFNEIKNGFTSFYTFKPTVYGRWGKSFVSPSPFNPNLVYIHNNGDYSKWYSNGNDYVTSIPYILMIAQGSPDQKTDFNAIELNCLNKPNDIGNAIILATEQHLSYLNFDDFDSDELHDILYSSWIKNDSTISADNPLGLNDQDTSSLFGQYLLIKFLFKQGRYNKLFGVTIQGQPRSRLNTT